MRCLSSGTPKPPIAVGIGSAAPQSRTALSVLRAGWGRSRMLSGRTARILTAQNSAQPTSTDDQTIYNLLGVEVGVLSNLSLKKYNIYNVLNRLVRQSPSPPADHSHSFPSHTKRHILQ
jgi:hypothetical protein